MKVMRLWLPDSLYRLKPFLLVVAGGILFSIAPHWFTRGLGVLCLGVGAYILVARLMWSQTGMIKTSTEHTRAGEQRVYDIRTSKK